MVEKAVKKKVIKKVTPKKLSSNELKTIELQSEKKRGQGLEAAIKQLEDRVLALQIQLLEKERVILDFQKGKLVEKFRLEDETYQLFFEKVKRRLGVEKDFSYNPWSGEINDSKI